MMLKQYQRETLEAIKGYFDRLDFLTPEAAYRAEIERSLERRLRVGAGAQYVPLTDTLPVVSIKVPTGGGKTIIAAHAVKVIAQAQGRRNPLVLWFAPSDTIRRQTAEALKKRRHPYRQALDEAFGGNVRVYDLDEIFAITPEDLAGNVCLVVATEQAFVKRAKEKYNVYKHNENFERHFVGVALAEGMDAQERNAQKPKFSFVNLARARRPIVIVDEAHKMTSALSRETLLRLAPSAVLGLTATPEAGNNTLYGVYAGELFREEMIKLPIELTEFRAEWEQAVLAALAKRKELEALADREVAEGVGGYLRPLVLFQASKVNGMVPVEKLKAFLLERVPAEEVAVVTGEQKELDEIDVTDPKVPIRYVITVQALKEGWDCPSAYVLCSVANITSNTDTIQLLGRVMRQPGARRRKMPQLNHAYAFVLSQSFGSAAREFAEGLHAKGFEENEAQSAIVPQEPTQWLAAEEEFFQPAGRVAISARIYEAIAERLPPEVRVEVQSDGSGHLVPSADYSEEAIRATANALYEGGAAWEASCFMKAVGEAKRRAQAKVPAEELTMVFPQLVAWVAGESCVDGEEAEELVGEELEQALPQVLPDGVFEIRESGESFTLELKGNTIQMAQVAEQLSFLKNLETELTESKVVNEVAEETVCVSLRPEVKRQWIAGVVRHLVVVKGFKPEQLYCFRHKLVNCLMECIAAAKAQVRRAAYQQVFCQEAYPLEVEVGKAFRFDRQLYQAEVMMKVYRGAYRFAKHFLGPDRVPAFDGTGEGEEFECAKVIDVHPAVRTWLRNLDGNARESFWLPLAHARFYPDFVGLLNDGRCFAVEYKGEHLRESVDTLAKDAIGCLWAKRSGGTCLYATVYKKLQGRDVEAQLNRLFARE